MDTELVKENLLEKGFVVLKNIIDKNAHQGLAELLQQANSGLENNSDDRLISKREAGGDFRNYSNSLDFKHPSAEKVWGNKAVSNLLDSLGEDDWLITRLFGFELVPGNAGLDWHFGFRSFSFIEATDPGYTLWVPLDPINPDEQGGGCAIASKEIYSGLEETKLLVTLCNNLDDEPLVKEVLSNLGNFRKLREPILEKYMTNSTFEPGDALLFDRYTFHRSVAFLEGSLASRRALAFRFVPSNATFNPELVAQQKKFFGILGVPEFTDSIEQVFPDLKSGQKLGSSNNATRISN